MKNYAFIFALLLTISASAQSKAELITLMNEYAENYGKPAYRHDFVDTTLHPALQKVEKLICVSSDTLLLDSFLKMMLKTKASADEEPADVLGGIFICKPLLVKQRLTEKFKDPDLIELLKFGFANRTYERKNEIDNYLELAEILRRIKE